MSPPCISVTSEKCVTFELRICVNDNACAFLLPATWIKISSNSLPADQRRTALLARRTSKVFGERAWLACERLWCWTSRLEDVKERQRDNTWLVCWGNKRFRLSSWRFNSVVTSAAFKTKSYQMFWSSSNVFACCVLVLYLFSVFDFYHQ